MEKIEESNFFGKNRTLGKKIEEIRTLIFLSKVNIAQAVKNSSYQIQPFLMASFEAKELLLCVTEPDFEISPRGGPILVAKL